MFFFLFLFVGIHNLYYCLVRPFLQPITKVWNWSMIWMRNIKFYIHKKYNKVFTFVPQKIAFALFFNSIPVFVHHIFKSFTNLWQHLFFMVVTGLYILWKREVSRIWKIAEKMLPMNHQNVAQPTSTLLETSSDLTRKHKLEIFITKKFLKYAICGEMRNSLISFHSYWVVTSVLSS